MKTEDKIIHIKSDCTTCGGEESPNAGTVREGGERVPCPECAEYTRNYRDGGIDGKDE